MAKWWHDEEVRDQIQALHQSGTSTRAIAHELVERGFARIPEHTLRARFSRLGWAQPEQASTPLSLPAPGERAARDELRVLRRLRDDEARHQQLLRALTAGGAPYPIPQQLNRTAPLDNSHRTIVLLLGDIHAGLAVDTKEVGSRYAHSRAELETRYARWESAVVTFVREQEAVAPVSHICILGLGDWVENAQLHENSRLYTYETTVESVLWVARKVVQSLSLFEQLFAATIELNVLAGNHDRVGQKGEFRFYDSWAGIISAYLEAALTRTPRVTIIGHTLPYVFLGIGNRVALAVHGDGMGSTQAAIEKNLARFYGLHGRRIDYFFMGHLHRAHSWVTTSGIKAYINGAFSDSSSYAANQLRLAAPAMQHALSFTSRGGIAAEQDLELTSYGILPADIDHQVVREQRAALAAAAAAA